MRSCSHTPTMPFKSLEFCLRSLSDQTTALASAMFSRHVLLQTPAVNCTAMLMHYPQHMVIFTHESVMNGSVGRVFILN
jgi:hypothetical protein